MRKIIVLICGLLFAGMIQAGSSKVVNLAVEYQEKPLAIDHPHPRFSWVMQSDERGVRQSAYQILLAESEGALKSGKLLWDSGKVNSAQSSGIVYQGPGLKSKRNYFWRVKVWDGNGNLLPEEETGFFRTGLMEQKDLLGKWIWEDDKVKVNDFAYFRTEVELVDDVESAYAIVSAHNHYILYINGKQVSGYVSPAPTDPYKSKYYVAYDLKPFLNKGKNCVAAKAHYKGASGQNYINGVPGFLFEAEVNLKNGKSLNIASGPEWRVLANTPYDENAPALSNRRHTQAEFFDAGKEPRGWTEPGFDDSSWSKPVVVNPEFYLKAQQIPESQVMGIITPVKVSQPAPGVYLFDLGEEIGGWARISASAPAGTAVKMRYSDRLFLGRAYQGASDEPSRTYYDQYTFAGKGIETWEPNFGYRGFRYIEVTGFPGKLSAENIKGVFVRTALAQTAEFESSNELLNKIYKISVHTQALGMVGQLVDCVHREQSQWHADAEIQSGTVFYNFYYPQIVRKTLLDLKDGQFEDGRLNDFYPSSRRDFNYIPEWDFHYLPMLWRTYYYYDDKYILEEAFPAVEKMMNFYLGWIDKNGLLRKNPGWHISDWPEDFARVDQGGDYLTVGNLKFYDDLVKAADIAKILGKGDLEKKYRTAAENLKQAINRELYVPALKSYKDCSGSKKHHQAVSALALQVGVVPESERDAVMKFVKSKGFGSSVVLAYNLFEMLYDSDEGEFAYELVNSEKFPGWGYMLKKGATNTWEGWTGLGGETYAHPFSAYMARFFISGIVGIKPGAPGWKEIIIRPHPEGDLKWAKARIRILPGEVFASWEKTENGLKLSVTIPGNTQAKVSVPTMGKSQVKIYEGLDQILPASADAGKKEVKFLSQEKGYANFMIGSGQYMFKVEY